MAGGDDDRKFFEMREEGKAYISKVFKFSEASSERLRHVNMVLEDIEPAVFGEVEGALCLRLSGDKRKTGVSALVSQRGKEVRRVTLQSWKSRAGEWFQGYEKDSFTFRAGEFQRLVEFLERIKFIDLSNEENFQVEDISTGVGPKAIIDAVDKSVLSQLKEMDVDQREALFRSLSGSLSGSEINILLGRKQATEVFASQIKNGEWSEKDWQNFFDRERWVFGYGLDYRIMRQFDREMTVGGSGTDNRNKPTVDFLMNFSDYTVLVEIKKPNTDIFQLARHGRAGTWRFSAEFMDSVSQILEQKAEWLAASQTGEHYNREGDEKLRARTRNAKAILVIGSRDEFERSGNEREANIKRDTFELFRRETTNIDIVTYDELLERARFITQD